jgi:hypothetical protein
MKRIVTLLAAVAMLAASSVASAADNLWFTMLSTTDGSITAVGGPGQTLDINKPLPGPATVRIGVHITSQFGPFAGWTMQLASSAGGAFAAGLVNGTYDQTIDGIVNGSSSASFGAGSSSLAGTDGLIYSFDLVLGGPVPVYVTGDFGQQGIIHANGYRWNGFVGANPFSYGAGPGYVNGPDVTPGWGELPVIAVTPEPTTLVLLGMGAVALLRRRK